MAPGKRRRKSPAVARRTVPADVLLEIVARSSDPATLVRCAALCKSLRREILHPSFLRRVTREDGGIIQPRLLACLDNVSFRSRSRNRKLEQPLVSLVHPATHVASSFMRGNLAPYMRHLATGVHGSYHPLMSRGGLLVLQRRESIGISSIETYQRSSDLCVFNPMTGDRTYLSCPSGLYPNWFKSYVLLTAADGIGCPFMLLATKMDRCQESDRFRITVQGAKILEAGGTSWGPVSSDTHSLLRFGPLQHQREPVILPGGVIHWLLSYGDQVLTYDICTQRLGTVKLPPTNYGGSQQIIGTSPDGRLRLLGSERFMLSMWVRLSDGWAKEAMIDVEYKIQSLCPNIYVDLTFKHWGERSDTVLLQTYRSKNLLGRRSSLIVLDLEMKEMRKQKLPHTFLLFEVDLSMRLQAMKIY